jgi:hypothetical protein
MRAPSPAMSSPVEKRPLPPLGVSFPIVRDVTIVNVFHYGGIEQSPARQSSDSAALADRVRSIV